MLNDSTCFKAVDIVNDYTNFRSGMDCLRQPLNRRQETPYVTDTLYLFCGRLSDRIKDGGYEANSVYDASKKGEVVVGI